MSDSEREEHTNVSDDSVVRYNQKIVQAESQEIEDFIQRYQWKMEKTPTGLRYLIYRQGRGQNPQQGDKVKINYEIKLLTGESVYQSNKKNPEIIVLGKRSVMSGLEEGVTLLTPGSKAKLIIPSHLALGLLGDLRKIPASAVLVCDLELCETMRGKK